MDNWYDYHITSFSQKGHFHETDILISEMGEFYFTFQDFLQDIIEIMPTFLYTTQNNWNKLLFSTCSIFKERKKGSMPFCITREFKNYNKKLI